MVLGCALLCACPNTSRPEPVSIRFSQSVVYLEPGESAKVMIAHSNLLLRIVQPDVPTTAQPLPASPLTLSLQPLEAFGRSVLDVSVASTALPGRHDVRFSRGAEVAAVLAIVVVPTDATPVAGAIESVAAGELHTLARKADGTVWACGRNDYGQLGDGTLIDRTVPVQVAGLPLPAVAVAAGDGHSLVLLQDNTVWGFGRTDRFQLRVQGSSIEAQPTPVRVSAAGTVVASIAAGRAHSLLRTDSGSVIAWGDNASGQTSSLLFANTTVDGLPLDANVVAAGYDVSYAVLAGDTLWAWGDGSFGQLGPSADAPRPEARQVMTVDSVDAVAVGARHALVLANGTVRAFGENASSQLGDGSVQTQIGQPVIVPRLLTTQQIAAGGFHSLALQSDGRVLQWGLSVNGQAGTPVAPPNAVRNFQLLPEVALGLPNSMSVDAGGRHSLAVTTSTRSLYAWGNSTFGQLGDGTIATSRAAVVPAYGTGSSSAERYGLTLLSRGKGTLSAIASSAALVDQQDATRGLVFAVPRGELVTLTALPEAGSAFIDWGGQAAGSNPTVQVTMDRSRACLARFGVLPRPDFAVTTFVSTALAVAERDGDDDGVIVSWEWDLGNDGSIDGTGNGLTFDRTEDAIDLRLRVTDNDGLTSEQVQTIPGTGSSGNPGNGGNGSNGPVANFYVLPEMPLAMFPTTFGGDTSTSPLGPLTSWQWDFTNDGTFDASGPQATFTYEAPGTYSVRLVVTDQNGQTASIVQQVVVTLG